MTKYELLSLLRTEDLFTGESNLDRKEWLDREDVLNFFSDMDEGDSHILQEMIGGVDKAWKVYDDMNDIAHVLYRKDSAHIATAIKSKLYKTAEKTQEIIYMMIEDFLEIFIDIDGLKEEPIEEERDYDYLREER